MMEDNDCGVKMKIKDYDNLMKIINKYDILIDYIFKMCELAYSNNELMLSSQYILDIIKVLEPLKYNNRITELNFSRKQLKESDK